MTVEKSSPSIDDSALARAMTEHASFQKEGRGEPVTDEEMAVLVEGKAEAILGKVRTAQIMSQIYQDDRIHHVWLLLKESQQLDGDWNRAVAFGQQIMPTPAPPTANRLTVWQWFLAGLKERWLPRPGLAAIFSATLCATVLFMLLPGPETGHQSEPIELSRQELPQKAELGRLESAPGPAGTAGQMNPGQINPEHMTPLQAISDTLMCGAHPASLTVCVSDTSNYQNWYTIRGSVISAVIPPLEAERVASLRQHGRHLLLEYVDDGKFQLALFRIENTDVGHADFKTVHTDRLDTGHYEQVVLDEKNLHYTRIVPDAQNETRQVPLWSDSSD